jgi:hypothetical protein
MDNFLLFLNDACQVINLILKTPRISTNVHKYQEETEDLDRNMDNRWVFHKKHRITEKTRLGFHAMIRTLFIVNSFDDVLQIV